MNRRNGWMWLWALGGVLCASGCDGETCPEGGTGTVVVTFTGLPSGVTGNALLVGATEETLTAPRTLEGVGGGAWGVTAAKVTQADPRVRTAYAPTVTPASFCLADGQTQTVEVAWAPIATSNKVWATNGNGSGQLLAFASSVLAATASQPATVVINTGAGKDVAFDKDGNLWALGPTTAEPQVVRYAASSLGSSGTRTRDRGFSVADLDCLPALTGLAFDPAGNLWVSSPCRDAVMKISADQLASGATEVTPAVTLSSLPGAAGIAFDSAGNLWVASSDSERLVRFDVAQQSVSDSAPALRLAPRISDDTENNGLFRPGWLAFDAAGDLWANDFGGNIFFRVPVAELTGTGDRQVNPAVRLTVPVSALIEGMAFDEGGGLWTAYSSGKLARLDPSQLTTSTGAGAPTVPQTVITSAEVGSVGNVALYPAPASSPLYHRLP